MIEPYIVMFADRSRKKNHRRYLFYRFYCVIVLIFVYATVFYKKFHEGYSNDNDFYELVLILLLIPAIFMILNLCAFKFPYSIFGNLESTPPPNEMEIYSVRVNWGQIGWMYGSGPFFSYKLYPSGLAMSVWGIGKAFLPLQFVEEVKKNILMGYRVIHHSPEIRSPIVFADKELFEAFQKE